MSFFDFNISGQLQKGWARYIIHRYLGQYLQQNLSLDQMDLTTNSVKICSVNLNVEFVNEKLKEMNLPLKLVDGYIGELILDIPWRSLSSNSSRLCVSELEFTFQVKEDVFTEEKDLISSVFGGMAENLVSPKDIAKDYYTNCENTPDSLSSEAEIASGIHSFTKVIDTIVSRFCMDINGITIRLEVLSKSGVHLTTALEFRIKKAQFMDEQVRNNMQNEEKATGDSGGTVVTSKFENVNKVILINDIEVYTDMFSDTASFVEDDAYKREKKKSMENSILSNSDPVMSTTSEVNFTSCYSSFTESYHHARGNGDKDNFTSLASKPVKFLHIPGNTEVLVRLSGCFSELELNVNCSNVYTYIVPSQLDIIKSVVNFLIFGGEPQSAFKDNQRIIDEHEYENVIEELQQDSFSLGGNKLGTWRGTEVFQPFHSIRLENNTDENEEQHGVAKTESDHATKESLTINFDIGTVFCCIPHFDPLSYSSSVTVINVEEQVTQLLSNSNKFFEKIDDSNHFSANNGYINDEHLMIRTALRFTYYVKKDDNKTYERYKLLFRTFRLSEFLRAEGHRMNEHPLIHFLPSESDSGPDIKILYTSSSGEKSGHVHLKEIASELDITILDRIIDIFSPNNYISRYVTQYQKQILNHLTSKPLDPISSIWKIGCEKATLDIRIPKADLSNSAKPKEKRIHDEFLRLALVGIEVTLPLEGNSTNFTCLLEEIEGDFFSLSQNSLQECTKLFYGSKMTKNIKIDVAVSSHSSNFSNNLSDIPELSRSLSGAILNNQEKREGPFSRIRKLYIDEDIVQAGSKSEMHQFRDQTSGFSDLKVKLFFPKLNFIIENRAKLELIYNRLANDFILWEPEFMSASASNNVFVNALPTQPETYYAFHDNKVDHGIEADPDVFNRNKSHSIAFELTADYVGGILTADCNIPDQPVCKSTFTAEDAELFAVAGYHGDMNHSFFYFRSGHFGLGELMAETEDLDIDMKSDGFGGLDRSNCEIRSFNCDPKKSMNPDDSIALAAHFHFQPDDNVKDILLAINLHNTTIEVDFFREPEKQWLLQLINLFTLDNYDVPGYKLPITSNDVHVCLENVNVTYDHSRLVPQSEYSLTLRLGWVQMSAVVSQLIDTATYTLILENTSLDLNKKSKQPGTPPVSIRALMIGLFHVEVSYCLLALEEIKKREGTLLEVCCKNDVVNAWMCADSLIALIQIAKELSESPYFSPTPEEYTQESAQHVNLSQDIRTECDISKILSKALQETEISPRKPEKNVDYDLLANDNYLHQLPDPYAHREAYAVPTDDEFCFIEDGVIGSGVLIENSGVIVRNIANTSTKLVFDPHCLKKPTGERRNEKITSGPDGKHKPFIRFHLNNVSLQLHLFGGSDLVLDKSKQPFGTSPSSYDYNSAEKSVTHGTKRNEKVSIKVDLKKITILCQIYHDSSDVASTKFFSINDIIISDRVHLSSIKELLYQYDRFDQPKRTCAPFFALRVLETKAGEGKIRTSLLPFKLNIDQDTMLFIEDFVQDIVHGLESITPSATVVSYHEPVRSRTSSDYQPDEISGTQIETTDDPNVIPDLPTLEQIADNGAVVETDAKQDSEILEQMEESKSGKDDECHGEQNTEVLVKFDIEQDNDDIKEEPNESAPYNSESMREKIGEPVKILERNSQSEDIYYRDFTFFPAVSIFIDYHGKNKMNIDRGGAMLGILKGFAQLHGTEIVLKEFSCKNGLLGLSSCIEHAKTVWSDDIVKSLPHVIASYSPISPIVQIGRGFMDLFYLPFAELKKPDGHIVKGIQKGVGSFSMSSAAGVVGIAQSVVGAVQLVGEAVLNEVQPDGAYLNKRNRSKALARTNSPTDFPQGLQMAYKLVADGVKQTKEDYQLTAQEDRASGSTSLKTIVKFAPPALLRPLVIGFQISFHLLGGIRNQLRPDIYKDECLKWEHEENVPGDCDK